MDKHVGSPFDPAAFLSTSGIGRRIVQLKKKAPFFLQGDPADAVFFIQKGSAKLTVVSKAGKEATIALLKAGEFVGEEAVTAVRGFRLVVSVRFSPSRRRDRTGPMLWL